MKRLTEKSSSGKFRPIPMSVSISDIRPWENCIERLAEIENIIGDEYDLAELYELVKAKQEGRLIVLPFKTVFVPTWDAGPDCDENCPHCFYGHERCDICEKGKLFIYEIPCRQEHISLLGRTVFATREEAESKSNKGE